MADKCAIYTVAGLTINAATGNTYLIGDDGEIEGLDGMPIRRTVDNRPQTDGAILFPAFGAARRITFEGTLLVRGIDPFGNPTAYLAAMNALEAAMTAALDGIINADATLSWNSGADTITVRRDETPTAFRGSYPFKRFLFGLIAATPTIS